MKIKGTSVSVTFDFVRKRFPESLNNWIEQLPEGSKKIFQNPIISMEWYPFMEGMIFPTETVGNLFFAGDHQKAADEIGKYSATVSLSGVYKIFVRIASTSFVLKRTSQLIHTTTPHQLILLNRPTIELFSRLSESRTKGGFCLHGLRVG